MVRLTGKDNLDELKGLLGTDFRSVALAALHLHFFFDLTDQNKKQAAVALNHFYNAAGKLHIRENEFNKRSRPKTKEHHTLFTNLRDADHLRTLREFTEAKATILEINPAIAPHIIHLVQRDIDYGARNSRPRSNLAPKTP